MAKTLSNLQNTYGYHPMETPPNWTFEYCPFQGENDEPNPRTWIISNDETRTIILQDTTVTVSKKNISLDLPIPSQEETHGTYFPTWHKKTKFLYEAMELLAISSESSPSSRIPKL